MRVHHLNCGSMCPVGGRLTFGPDAPRKFVCHCLLIETDEGLVLIDTGMGLDDVAQGTARMGRMFMGSCRPPMIEAECAVRQIEALGFKAEDVRHIVPTHLDLDHAGGLPDFPNATVHIYEPEHAEAMKSTEPRYVRGQIDGATYETYRADGEPWFGFECARQLRGLPPEILIVPVTGHSAGHAAIAVDTPDGWLLHCGDAYFHRAEARPELGKVPIGLEIFQSFIQHDGAARKRNQARLRDLAREHGDEVRLFCAHDVVEYEGFAQAP